MVFNGGLPKEMISHQCLRIQLQIRKKDRTMWEMQIRKKKKHWYLHFLSFVCRKNEPKTFEVISLTSFIYKHQFFHLNPATHSRWLFWGSAKSVYKDIKAKENVIIIFHMAQTFSDLSLSRNWAFHSNFHSNCHTWAKCQPPTSAHTANKCNFPLLTTVKVRFWWWFDGTTNLPCSYLLSSTLKRLIGGAFTVHMLISTEGKWTV